MTSPPGPAATSAVAISPQGASSLQLPVPVLETNAIPWAPADVAAAARARAQIPPMEIATRCVFMAFASLSSAAPCGRTHEASTEAQGRRVGRRTRVVKLNESLRRDAAGEGPVAAVRMKLIAAEGEN